MNTKRIKQIQQMTAFPDSVSVLEALLQVLRECKADDALIQKVLTHGTGLAFDNMKVRQNFLKEVYQKWCELDQQQFDKWLHDKMQEE